MGPARRCARHRDRPRSHRRRPALVPATAQDVDVGEEPLEDGEDRADGPGLAQVDADPDGRRTVPCSPLDPPSLEQNAGETTNAGVDPIPRDLFFPAVEMGGGGELPGLPRRASL
ncbi:MAG: hypothetical protein V5A27_06410 [Halapricum sp.]